ncbi:MAG: hypothetical protein QM784_08410 [Polyangiaceae bacterium]
MMEAEDKDVDLGREQLTRQADYVRARMLSRVDTLDERRHKLGRTIAALVSRVSNNLPAIAGVAAVAVLGLGVAVVLHRKRRREVVMLASWPPPAVRPREKSSGLLGGIATSLILHLAKRAGEAALLRVVRPGLPPRPRDHRPSL